MNLAIAKIVLSAIVGTSAGAVVQNVVKATLPQSVGVAGRVVATIGTFAIGVAVSELASQAFEKQIDDVVEVIHSIAGETESTTTEESE